MKDERQFVPEAEWGQVVLALRVWLQNQSDRVESRFLTTSEDLRDDQSRDEAVLAKRLHGLAGQLRAAANELGDRAEALKAAKLKREES